MAGLQSTSIGRAFQDPVLDSQHAFRTVLAAMAEPGIVHELDVGIDPPGGVAAAALVIALTLADQETPVWMTGERSEDVLSYIRFHTGCPIAMQPRGARFAILTTETAHVPLTAFDAGDERYPDRSATLIIECPSLKAGPATHWKGPGIPDVRTVTITPPRSDLWRDIRANNGRYPLGVDMFLVSGHYVVGLPRSTSVTEFDEVR